MNTEEQRKKIEEMRTQLRVLYDTAIDLKKSEVLTDSELTKDFEYTIKSMEACLNTASERIECIHPSIEIVSMNDHYGYGTIDMVEVQRLRCRDGRSNRHARTVASRHDRQRDTKWI